MMKTIRLGISLMEVLASTFVIGIGLLGVLAVIPFGAFQVSKARNAEYCSNMLAAAKNDVFLDNMGMMDTWKHADDAVQDEMAKTNIFDFTSGSNKCADCRRFIMVDPFGRGYDNSFYDDPDNKHIFKNYIYRVSSFRTNTRSSDSSNRNLNLITSRWQEKMRGGDDLLYPVYEDRRTDFATTQGRPTSSGKYTWFFMYRPKSYAPGNIDEPKNAVPIPNIDGTVDVDLLGCHDRVPGGERTLEIMTGNTTVFEKYFNGARIRLKADSVDDLDLSKTRYLFIAWESSGSSDADKQFAAGGWFRILNAVLGTGSNSDNSLYRDVFVQASQGASTLPQFEGSTTEKNPKALVMDGVMYHMNFNNVPTWKGP